MSEPSPEFAAAVEAAGLLHAEYPDQMAAASCTCEPEAVCGAHRLLARYQQMYDHMVTVQAERRQAKAEVRALTARLDTAPGPTFTGKAKTNPSTLHMDGTSPVVVYVQATTDELRALHNQQVEVRAATADPTPQTDSDHG